MIAPLVIAVVLNWNRRDDTLACVASLLESTYQPLRVLVCDNASVDDTPAAVRSAYPSVEVLELGYNRGFAGGANAGLRYGEHIFLCRREDPPALAEAIQVLHHDPVLRQGLSENGRRIFVEQFDIEPFGQRYRAHLEQILEICRGAVETV